MSNQPLIDGTTGVPSGDPNIGKSGYHPVLSKVPSNADSILYKKGNTYYIVFTQQIAGETVSAFFEYTDPNGPSLGEEVQLQDNTAAFVQTLKVYDGSALSDTFIAESINLGKMNQLPPSYLNQRGFDPFDLMNIQAEKFIQKWGDYLTEEYDAVLDIVFQSAIQGIEINRQAIQDALPIGTEFNFRLIDYTNAKLTGPGAMAAWEQSQKEVLDTVLADYAGNFEFDNPDVYENLRALWTEGNVQNEAVLRNIVEKMFMDKELGSDFDEYFDSIKGTIYGVNNPLTLEVTKNRQLVSDDIDNLIGGRAAQQIKNDKKKMQAWQSMYDTEEGKAKVKDELQAIWDAGAPDALKGGNAYTQFLYFNEAMITNQGRNMSITHEDFDAYKYLNYGEMLEKSRGDGMRDGNQYTKNIVNGLLSNKLGDPKFEEKF